jgi:hypothetical protein
MIATVVALFLPILIFEAAINTALVLTNITQS